MLLFAMKSVYLFLYAVMTWDILYAFSSFTSKYRLSAVTPYSRDQSYAKIRNRNSGIHPQTDVEIRKRICHHIISSPLCLMLYEEPVYVDEVFIELRIYHTEIYEDLFEVDSSDRKVYANRSKLFEVFVENSTETVEENLFICLSRNTKDQNQKIYYRYFISDEYNVSDEFSLPSNYTAGRFVYVKVRSDDGNAKLHLLAIAEEPANVLVAPDFDVESHYLNIRRKYKSAENSSEDPICKFHLSQRRRICAQIFGAYNFEREVIFLPGMDNVYDLCEKKRISFRKNDAKKEANGIIYEEWMFGCTVQRLFTGYKFAYWLSRAYTSNQLFVYKYDFFSGKLFIDNLSVNVRLVYDDVDSKTPN